MVVRFSDPMVPERMGRAAVQALEAHDYEVEYRSYPMDHSVCAQEIADISVWLQRILN